MNKIYKLYWDLERPTGKSRDAEPVPYEGINALSLSLLSEINSELIPSKVFFYADFKMLEINQFVNTELAVPIMRNDMLDLIVAADDIGHLTVPAIMIDQKFKHEAFDKDNNFNPNVPNLLNYSCFGMYRKFEAFDYENSEYTITQYDDVKIVRASKLVLKSHYGYFPRIFKLKEMPTMNFVRGDVKELLEKSGMGGFEFVEIEVSS